MKLKLSTKLMKGIVAKLISKFIFKKTGCKIYIELNEINIRTEDGHIFIHADVDAETDTKSFTKLVDVLDKD